MCHLLPVSALIWEPLKISKPYFLCFCFVTSTSWLLLSIRIQKRGTYCCNHHLQLIMSSLKMVDQTRRIMDVTKKKKFGLEKNVFSTIWQDLFGSLFGALCGKISFGIVDCTIVLGLFNADSGIFFLIRLNYHLSGAITIREQFIDIIILAERYKIIFI